MSVKVAISFCRHRSVPIPCENGSAQTTVAEGGRNLVAGLWGHNDRYPTQSHLALTRGCSPLNYGIKFGLRGSTMMQLQTSDSIFSTRDLDRLHLSCSGPMCIYRNMHRPGSAKICGTVSTKSCRKGFFDIREHCVTLSFDLLTPHSCRSHALVP